MNLNTKHPIKTYMNIKIQRISEKTPQLSQFQAEQFAIADKEHWGDLIPDFTKYYDTFVVYDESNNIIGDAECIRDGGCLCIDSIQVDSDHQWKRIGTKLLQEIEKFARENHCHKIWLETVEWWWAVEFYRQNGFEQVATLKSHYSQKDCYIFSKFL